MTKVFLLFVEGETDETSLELMLNTIAKSNNIKTHFIVYGTDITQKENIDVDNILKELNKAVYAGFLKLKKKTKISLNDITKIYHIVDSDGVYIPDDCVIHKDGDLFPTKSKIEYTSSCIYTSTENYIKKRNARKSSILNKLCTKKEITISGNNSPRSIPYSIFYMSTNMEHVLHDIQNPTKKQKDDLADKWEFDVADKIEKINEFFDDKNCYIATGNYIDTWATLKSDLNSLSRLTNFKLLINEMLTIAKEDENKVKETEEEN